ncbi:MAG: sulfatase-like hydrolase/transferase [Pseudomonadota bacterium]
MKFPRCVSKPGAGAWTLLAVVCLLTLLDIALLERKYNLFTGGFLLAERIDTASARLVFAGTVFAVEFGLAGCFWYLFHLLGLYRGAAASLTRFHFLFVYGGISVAAIVAKYRVLSYFGDLLSVAVLRNLGGGTLSGAVAYGAAELMQAGAWAVPVLALAWYVHRRVKAGIRSAAPARRRHGAGALTLRLLVCVAGLFSITLAASADHTMNKFLLKTTPYALAQAVLEDLVDKEAPFLARFSQSVAATLPAAAHTEVSFGKRKDHLVLIVSESTRADVLAAEVEGRPVTPVWNGIAATGSVARQYYSHTGFTTSSLKAIFNASLGASRPLGGSLFEILKKNGYQIVVLSGQDESFGNIAGESRSQALADIFFDARSAKTERVFSSSDAGSLALSNARIVQEFDAVSRKLDWSRPVFVYINLQAAHFPYHHESMPRTIEPRPLARGEISEESRARLRSTYLNAVAYSDWATGEILARLKQAGAYERTLLAVSGDHGESLFDDGMLGHGIRLVDDQLKTLLLTNRPLPALGGLLGQTDLAAHLLRAVGASIGANSGASAPAARQAVVQIIGATQAPSQLGHVYADGGRFSVDNDNRELHAPWLPAPLPFEQLRPGSREHQALSALVRDWKQAVSAP